MQPSDVADILEKAADLYESEQIDWCKGSWGTRFQSEKRGHFHCAEGAILRAAGYSMQDIVEAQSSKFTGHPIGVDELIADPGVQAAFRAVCKQINLIVSEPKLWPMNDHLDPDEPEKAKQYLITVFKETAKDLRNKA